MGYYSVTLMHIEKLLGHNKALLYDVYTEYDFNDPNYEPLRESERWIRRMEAVVYFF